ncbi:ATP-binding protein [Streptomyces sp. NBC_00659]|uniref:ATP-binding protein n=1 Tax=unclassified Streptomyces TaxID=2593676 RepID=UPI002E302471|nr:ATP-binding protein [Streptomyces sp. NBC_00659]
MSGYKVTESRLRSVLPFEAAPAEVHLLRRATVKQLSRWGTPVAVDEAELLVAELATNVVKHVGKGASATLILEWTGERLRLEVHDKSPVVPSLRTAGCDQECGRGLHLLASLAIEWGTVLTAAGKAVWCEIGPSADRARLRVERAVEALERYQGMGGGLHPGGKAWRSRLEESAIELISDLLHWTADRGHDPDELLDRAQMYYEADAAAT